VRNFDSVRARGAARARRHGGDVAYALGAAALATLIALWTLDAWDHLSTIPLYYGATVPSKFPFDLNFHLMVVEGVVENGWYQSNPRLGAPFGQELYDFPLGGENLQFVLIKLLGGVAAQPGTVMNLYFLLTFPLTALSAYGVLRWLRASKGASLVTAVLFALLPYHFLRGEYHLFLSGYFTVPLGALLVLWVLGGDALFERGSPERRRVLAYASRRSLGVVAACVLIGSTSVYYAGLTVMFLVFAGSIASLVRRDRRPVLEGAVAIALIVGALLVNLAPSIAHRLDEGQNNTAAARNPDESELYSVKLTQLVLPSPHHRFEPIAEIGRRYTSSELLRDEETATLGLVAGSGFVWLLFVAFGSALGGLRWSEGRERHRHAAVAAGIAFLVGTTGGISALTGYYVSSQLRAYNRVSVFIAFFSLVAVALLLDSAARHLSGAGRPRPLVWVLMAAVLLVGVLDQTSPRFAPDHVRARAEFTDDARFVQAIEKQLPRGASVLQLPYLPFPESAPLFGMLDYDLARGYIHSNNLRWSYGAVKGRPTADWQGRLAGRPMEEVLVAAVAVGFSGVYVDTAGFPDAGGAIRADLDRVLMSPPLQSGSRRFAFYDLRRYGGALRRRYNSDQMARIRAATLSPAAVPPPP